MSARKRKGSLETEVKLRVANLSRLRRRIVAAGFRIARRRHHEDNYLFDFPGSPLRRRGCLLRVRLTQRAGLFTFKGPVLGAKDYKVRREIETEVKDGDTLLPLLENIGLEVSFRYEKFRTVFSRDISQPASPVVVLDETPIGNFLELEGDPRWIDRLARDLGYEKAEYIAATYAELYDRYCRSRGRKPGNMVFR